MQAYERVADNVRAINNELETLVQQLNSLTETDIPKLLNLKLDSKHVSKYTGKEVPDTVYWLISKILEKVEHITYVTHVECEGL